MWWRRWVSPVVGSIATPGTAARLLEAYPNAIGDIVVRTPSDFGVKRIGHEGAFRKGMEPLWEEILDWFDDGLPGAGADA